MTSHGIIDLEYTATDITDGIVKILTNLHKNLHTGKMSFTQHREAQKAVLATTEVFMSELFPERSQALMTCLEQMIKEADNG